MSSFPYEHLDLSTYAPFASSFFAKTTDIFLWVDAVCIDQEHHKERNHQVGQMKRIYENADNVIIWLGPGSHETDTLFKMIQRLDKESAEISRRAPIDTWIARWSDLLYEGSRIPAWQLKMLRDALREVLARKWFERIWVIQEAYSAQTATVSTQYARVSPFRFLRKLGLDVKPDRTRHCIMCPWPY
ncbi:Heterokaryon incompatibility protein 6 like [Verticillium longisporum]|nr:Heterokaryon incompatibility protein 6 like [Verticillium longisporum]